MPAVSAVAWGEAEGGFETRHYKARAGGSIFNSDTLYLWHRGQ